MTVKCKRGILENPEKGFNYLLKIQKNISNACYRGLSIDVLDFEILSFNLL